MAEALSNLNIRLNDDGTATVSAASRASEGHLWAIEPRPVSIRTVVKIAELLGEDAVTGVRARLEFSRARLAAEAARAQAAAERAAGATAALRDLEAVIEEVT